MNWVAYFFYRELVVYHINRLIYLSGESPVDFVSINCGANFRLGNHVGKIVVAQKFFCHAHSYSSQEGRMVVHIRLFLQTFSTRQPIS